jgi:hypothetical protein
MTSSDASRRDVLAAAATVGGSLAGAGATTSVASADGERSTLADVTLSYDKAKIEEYQPELVLQSVEPRPYGVWALHATKKGSGLNAVYGFTRYPYQQGQTEYDSHFLDHEPWIVWYDAATGTTERVDYAAYHWFRGHAFRDQLEFATDAEKRPVLRVDPNYHHYYLYSGSLAGERPEVNSLLDAIEDWLANGMDEELAVSQPYDPWAMMGRESWWREEARGSFEVVWNAFWFNLGLSDARATSDLDGVPLW